MLRLVFSRAQGACARNFSSSAPRTARWRTQTVVPKVEPRVEESVADKASRYDNYGRLFLGAACGAGIGGMCFYGLSIRPDSAAARSMLWPEYVRQRLRSTFGYFAVGLVATAGTVAALHRGTGAMRLAQYMQRHPYMSVIVPLGALMATGTGIQVAQNQPTKISLYLLSNAMVGAIISPLGFLGGPLLMRAAMVTGGALGALSLTAMCAPSKQYMTYSAPISLVLGGFMLTMVGGMFVPAGTAVAAGLNAVYLYGGLVLFGGLTLYDVQRMVDRAEHSPVYDPVSQSLSIYMDAINIFIRVAMIMSGSNRRR